MLTVTHKKTMYDGPNSILTTTGTENCSPFLLFRNTVERWYNGDRPVQRMPKGCIKIHACGGFCVEAFFDLNKSWMCRFT